MIIKKSTIQYCLRFHLLPYTSCTVLSLVFCFVGWSSFDIEPQLSIVSVQFPIILTCFVLLMIIYFSLGVIVLGSNEKIAKDFPSVGLA